jgi:DNA repair photolyase
MTKRPSQGDTITPYVGEFLISPIPLEMSGNWCSHACSYCFANLNKPGRWFDLPVTQKRIVNAVTNPKSLTERLLADGYPVLCSNRVDPFATSNHKQMLPVIRTMVDCRIPVSIQTRGGIGAEEGLSIVDRGLWYVSICQTDDAKRKEIEPGAPTIESRFELISKAAKQGINVVVGMNPLVPNWIPDIRSFMRRIAEAGARGIWIGWLHFNHDQIANMTPRSQQVLGDVLQVARKRNPDGETTAAIEEAVECAKRHDLKFYVSGGYPEYGGLWDLYRESYDKTFPVHEDWLLSCQKMSREQLDDAPISFEEYWEFMSQRLPKHGARECREYLRIRRAARTGQFREAANYHEVMRAIWSDSLFKQCPVNHDGFAWLGEHVADNEWIQLTDEDSLPLLTYGHPQSDDQRFVSDWRSSSWHQAVEVLKR